MRPLIIATFALFLGHAAWSAANEDPYAVTAKKTVADSLKKVFPDTTMAVVNVSSIDTSKAVAVQDSNPVAPDSAKAKARPRVVRETTVNTLDAIKGRYRSPKKALFMSLIVPGLGQAYIGGPFNYARAAGYIGMDVTMGLLWHQYSVVKYDRQVSKYRRYADEHWRQERYEDALNPASYTDKEQFELANQFRENFCESVQERTTTQGNAYFEACRDPLNPANAQNLTPYHDANLDRALTADSVHAHREKNYPNLFYFYELVGKEQEFVTGWDDVTGTGSVGDSVVAGTSLNRDHYIGMRATANRYARMQAWFLGGMVLNHIVSALDAALAARSHNKSLYQTETTWIDRVRFDGGLAFEQGWPRTNLQAALSF